MNTAYIALGSNLDGPLSQIRGGQEALNRLPNTRICAYAPLYASKPIGPKNQPDFINTVVCLTTFLQPRELLQCMQGIEDQHGRQRHVHWGARTLDLDFLLYNNTCLNDPVLTLPHPEMYHRSFVLQPLFDIAPDLIFPNGSILKTLLEKYDCSDLKKISE